MLHTIPLEKTELLQELTDNQAAQLSGISISNPETNTGVSPTLPPKIAALTKPFYAPLPIPKLARLKLTSRPKSNTQKDPATSLEE